MITHIFFLSLVCFPGQGWTVSEREKGEIKIRDVPEQNITYSTMRVGKDSEIKQLILYWFQSFDSANGDTLSQKISALKHKFTDMREDNAFVRITCNTAEGSDSECLERMQNFTKAFYPIFLTYIRE